MTISTVLLDPRDLASRVKESFQLNMVCLYRPLPLFAANGGEKGEGRKGAQVTSVVADKTLAPARQAGRGPNGNQTVELMTNE